MSHRNTTQLITAADLPDEYILLSMPEAAKSFQRSTATLAVWLKSGKLPTVRIGRRVLVRRSTLGSYLDALDPRRQPTPRADLSPIARGYLPFNEAATVLGISRNMLTVLSRDGRIKSAKFVNSRYVPVSALADFIDSNAIPATTGPLAGVAV